MICLNNVGWSLYVHLHPYPFLLTNILINVAVKDFMSKPLDF